MLIVTEPECLQAPSERHECPSAVRQPVTIVLQRSADRLKLGAWTCVANRPYRAKKSYCVNAQDCPEYDPDVRGHHCAGKYAGNCSMILIECDDR